MGTYFQRQFPVLQLGYLWGIVGLATVLLTACQTDKKIYPEGGFNATTVTEIHKTNAWSYDGETGPEHWSELSENEDCSGSHQSPINIIAVNAKPNDHAHDLTINYASGTHIHDVVNNGHTIKYNFESGDNIFVGDDQFDLIQVHFHEPAEHTINGVRYPMEMHMVHMNDDNEFAVIAVMVEEGNSSETFDFLEHYLPVRTGQTKPIDKAFDLNLSLPESKSYYYYHGSLTTPPCTESVEWFVMKDPISISLDQVKIMQALMPYNNYRNEQPLNDRVVYLVEENLPI